jgi:LytS/YehU family sensor histidine kinase
LKIDWFIEPRALKASVPTFILQPIVENSIRHGIAKLADSGLIMISAAIDGNELILLIEDDGSGMDNPERAREGVGLSNTRKRIEALFGSAGQLRIESKEGRGTRVSIRIPFTQEVE